MSKEEVIYNAKLAEHSEKIYNNIKGCELLDYI